jgi:hypothetical protein
MPSYLPLGSRSITGTADQTGNNAGNWTIVFNAAEFPDVPYFEIYKIIVTGAPNSTFDVFIGANQWEANQRGDNNVWNGAQQITSKQEVYFYWSDPVSDGNPPMVLMWLRYDTSIPQNQVGYRA